MRQCKRCSKETPNLLLCDTCNKREQGLIDSHNQWLGDTREEREYFQKHILPFPDRFRLWYQEKMEKAIRDAKKKPLVVRCERCSQEVKTHKNGYVTVITPCPCRALEIKRLNKLHGDYEIDSVSVHKILQDGTHIPMPHALANEEIEAWMASDE